MSIHWNAVVKIDLAQKLSSHKAHHVTSDQRSRKASWNLTATVLFNNALISSKISTAVIYDNLPDCVHNQESKASLVRRKFLVMK